MEGKTRQQAHHDELEVKLLTDAIHQKYGYDFHNYAFASFKRRLHKASVKYQCAGLADLLHKTLTDPDFFSFLLNDLTVKVTEMFRDPSVYRALREQVIPHLKTYPEVKIWCAGCSGGEEAFSLAILLEEESLLHRAILYGTDISPLALARARDGIVSPEAIREGTKNYFASGGKRSLSHYYVAKYEAALLNARLRDRIVFSDHNLVTDHVFGEMQLILCRNVLIYFNRDLQERTFALFRNSLCPGGFLNLGTKESLGLSELRKEFEEFNWTERIYRRKW